MDHKAYLARIEFNEELRELIKRGEHPGFYYQSILRGVLKWMEGIKYDKIEHLTFEEHMSRIDIGENILYQLLYGTYWFVEIDGRKIICNYPATHIAAIRNDIYSTYLFDDIDRVIFNFTGLDAAAGKPPEL